MEPLVLPVNYNDIHYSQRKLVREEYIRIQDGKCHACKAALSGPVAEELKEVHIDSRLFPPGFLSNPIHLHHDHNTGMTIGAVHAKCNAMLWQYHGE